MDASGAKFYINEYGDKIYINLKKQFHRLDGSAIEYVNGDKEWWVDGKHHRADGPAIEWTNGYRFWFILNEELKEEEFNLWINRIRKFL